jgi:alcohol dehydrogenase (cytochrome c)
VLAWLAPLAAQHPAFVPVTDAMIQNPDPADWLMWRRTLNSWGYSPLNQITADNVRTLRLVWTRTLAPGIQEGTPLVYRGVMYFPNPLDVVEAIDAATGDLKWQYRRTLPDDLAKFFPVPAINRNLAINPRLKAGERRKVITGIPGKTGLVYTLDRQTGEFLWARPTVLQTVISDIDGATGEVKINPEALFNKPGDTAFVCPTTNGGKNWPAGAYSPTTNMMYMPLANTCMELTAVAESRRTTTLYGTSAKPAIAPNTNDNVGNVYAISAGTGAIAWKFEQRAGTTSLIATGGGLLFGGDVNGRFRALDQRSGKVLWETNLGSPVTGYPVAFAVNGRQYVAVSTGSSLATGGLARLTPELRPSSGNNLFVFALP